MSVNILSAGKEKNYDYLLQDIESVVFVTGGGTNDVIESIAGMISLINYYCPKCKSIYITDNWVYNITGGGVTSHSEYYLNLSGMDARINFFCHSLWYDELGVQGDCIWGRVEALNLGIEPLLYNDDVEFKWNYFSPVESWHENTGPVYIDKLKKIIFVNKQISRWKENNRELFNWNNEILDNYFSNVVKFYNSNLTDEVEEFINSNNIKKCSGLHIRLDNWWKEIIERMVEHNELIYCPNNDWNQRYDYDKIITNINEFSNPSEFKNSYLKNIERLIQRKLDNNELIFLAADCPVTANYLTTKYYNVIQYKDYEITEWYRQWFFNKDVSSPYNRNHVEFNRGVFENKSNFLPAERCVVDYLCLMRCKEVFGSNGGIYKLIQQLGMKTYNIAIESELMKYYQNKG